MLKRYWWMLLVMVPVGMMAGLLVSAAVTYKIPKKYESYATIEIKLQERVIDTTTLPMFISDELSKIKSGNSLIKVIDSLDLTNRWGTDRETALQILKGIVVTENISGTDLIQIRVRHTNKVDARDIAAEVAKTYKEHRDAKHSALMENWINELRRAVREKKDTVEEKRKILTIITRHKGDGGGADPVDRQDYIDAKRDFETDLSLLEQLELKFITEKLSQGLPHETVVIHDDPVIADSPTSPNVTLNLVAGTLGGLLLSPFLALPLMAFMNRKPDAAP